MRVPGTDAHAGLGLVLAVDAELFRLDSLVRWLDGADARLKRADADTTAGPAAKPGPEPEQGRSPLPRHRRELRMPR